MSEVRGWLERHGGQAVPQLLSSSNDLPGIRGVQRMHNGRVLSTDEGNLLAVIARPDADERAVQFEFIFEENESFFTAHATYTDQGGDGQLLDHYELPLKAPALIEYPFLSGLGFFGGMSMLVLSPVFWLSAGGGILSLATIVLGLIPVEMVQVNVTEQPDEATHQLPNYDPDQLQAEPEIKQVVSKRHEKTLWTYSVGSDLLSGPPGELSLKNEFEKQHALSPPDQLRPTDEDGVYLAFTQMAYDRYHKTFDSTNQLEGHDGDTEPLSGEAEREQDHTAPEANIRRRIQKAGKRTDDQCGETVFTDRAKGLLCEVDWRCAHREMGDAYVASVRDILLTLFQSQSSARAIIERTFSSGEITHTERSLLALPKNDLMLVNIASVVKTSIAMARAHFDFDPAGSISILLTALQTDAKSARILHDHGLSAKRVLNLGESSQVRH